MNFIAKRNDNDPNDGSRIQIDLAGASDIGKKRSINQDHFLIANLKRLLTIEASNVPRDQCDELSGTKTGQLLVVADGMGGHAAGELASSTAIQSCARYVLNMMHWFLKLSESHEEDFQDELADCLKSVQRTIWSDGKGSLKGMGTTVTMAYVIWPRMYVVHAGDSRCYLQRGTQLQQLTTDHTLAQKLVDNGAISPAEAETSRWRHLLWNCVGGNEQTVHPEVFRVTLEPNDTVLVCSDGVTGMIDDREISNLLRSNQSSEATVKQLIGRANAGGGTDNITAIVGGFPTSEESVTENDCFQATLRDTDFNEVAN